MRKGISQFIYREIDELFKKGIEVKLFPTKYANGLYNPEKGWECYKYKKFNVLLKQPIYFTKNPIKYLTLFFEAIKNRTIITMLLAFDFSNNMKDIDRIHCHFGDNKLFIGYYCKKVTGKPLTVTIHAQELYSKLNEKMFKKSLNFCDKIITISNHNKNVLIKEYGIDDDKIQTIRLFTDLDDYKPYKKIKILIVANFVGKKGHEILFKAVKNLKNVELWVVGGGEIDLVKKAEELGLNNVCFFGSQSGNALKSLYNECDIFCLFSVKDENGEKEGIPVVLMEAMSFGKPVVSTLHAGIPELVEKILVKEKDVVALTNALKKLIGNPDLRKRLGERNRQIIKEKYSLKNLDQLIGVFNG